MSRYSKGDKVWKDQVFLREGGRCAVTGLLADDAHHIAGKGAWPGLRWKVYNGIALTRAQHRWAHDKPAEFRAWLKKDRPVQWAEVEAAKRLDAIHGKG